MCIRDRSEAVEESAQTIPLSLISVATELSSAPTYQSSAQLPSGANSLKYSTNAWFGGPSDQQIDLPTSIDASELSVFDVTTASSSAVGLLAAPASYTSILGTSEASLASPLVNQLAYGLSDLAPPATFKNGAIEMPSEVQTGSSLKAQFNLLSTELTTRLADGAYVDNTSAAYMVKQIQSEQTIDDSFYLTIFSNSTSTPESGITMPGVSQTQAFTVTSDIADLFGYSDGKVSNSAIITNTTCLLYTSPSPRDSV